MLAILLSFSSVFASTLDARGDLVFSEFMADTSAGGQVPEYYGEWFEVYNNSGATQDLAGVSFQVSTNGGQDWNSFVVQGTLLVGAYDYVVFGVSKNQDSSVAKWNGNIPVDYEYKFFDASVPTYRFDLSAPQSWLQVYNEDGAIMLDEVKWDPSWSAMGDNTLSVADNALAVEWANDFSVNWCLSDTLIQPSGLKGTPGVQNGVTNTFYCAASPGLDADGDGWSPAQGDCKDNDTEVHPGAVDAGTGDRFNTDDDCDGIRDDGETDDDGDGYSEVGGDCDDEDVTTYPGVQEIEDGEDDDCNGCIDDIDGDGDGFSECPELVDLDGNGVSDDPWYDCDDANADINPREADVPYNGIDEDCSGLTGIPDEEFRPEDLCDVDQDGYGSVTAANPNYCEDPQNVTDCDDINPAIRPGAEEDPDDGLDNDCDGIIDIPDRDEDGYTEDMGDCMDISQADLEGVENAAAIYELARSVHPDADEICGDLVDNDCSGFADDLPSCKNSAAYGVLSGGGLCAVAPDAMPGLGLLLGLLLISRRRS